MKEHRLRILLVDDHRMLREGLRLLIAQQPDMTVVGEASDVRGALAAVIEHSPDLVVMDVHLPDGNGIEASQQILAERPATKIVILSAHPDPAYVNEALQKGVCAYLLKENAAEDLIRAIHTVVSGKLYLCSEMMTALLRDSRTLLSAEAATPKPLLSARDLQLLRLIAEGRRNKDIAASLDLSPKSIETYRSRLMAKLGCATPAELVRYAIREGIIDP